MPTSTCPSYPYGELLISHIPHVEPGMLFKVMSYEKENLLKNVIYVDACALNLSSSPSDI